MSFCRYCGSELLEGVCPSGHSQNPPEQNAAPQTPESSAQASSPPLQSAVSPAGQPPQQPQHIPPPNVDTPVFDLNAQAYVSQTPIFDSNVQAFSAPESSPATPSSSKKKSKAPIIILVLIIVFLLGVIAVGLVVAALFFFLRSDDTAVTGPTSSFALPYSAVTEPREEAPAPAPEETSMPAEAAIVADESLLLSMLQQSDYAMWHTIPLSTDMAARSNILNSNNWNASCGVISMGLWANSVYTSDVMADLYTVSGEDLQATASSFYGVDNYQMGIDNFRTASGGYTIPAHGPMHTGELLPDTLSVDGQRMSVQSRITYFDGYGEDANQYQVVLLHTFEPNPENSFLPFRVVSIEELESNIPLVAANVVAPTNLYDPHILVEVNVLELNLREGPGTNHEAVDMLNEGQQLEIIGDDGSGEWICTYYGWVSAEYVTVLGNL